MRPLPCISCGFPSGLGIPPKSLFASYFSIVSCLGSRLLEPFLFLSTLFYSLTHRVRLRGKINMEITWLGDEREALDH